MIIKIIFIVTAVVETGYVENYGKPVICKGFLGAVYVENLADFMRILQMGGL